MNLTEKLKEIKEKYKKILNDLKEDTSGRHKVYREYEFEADLEDHGLGDKDVYRLHFVGYYYSKLTDGYHVHDYPLSTFKLPEGMTREEGFKILSYLTDFIEKREDVEEASEKSVITLDKILDLERFGFKKVKEKDESKIADLFTVAGRILRFKKSKYYDKYYNWYTENVRRSEIEKIYANHNMEFQDIVWLNNPTQRTLKPLN